MKLATFLVGMAASTALVAGASTAAGLSLLSVVGLSVATVVVAQGLYLGLILLMTREEVQHRARQAMPDASVAPAVSSDLAIAGSQRTSPQG